MRRFGDRRALTLTITVVAILAASLLLAQPAAKVASHRDGEAARERSGREIKSANDGPTPGSTPNHAAWMTQRSFGPPRVATERLDALGRDVTVSCASCHANFSPNTQLASSAELDEFHQGLTFQHGKLLCVSCHQPPTYSTLHLADHRELDYGEAQRLCAQCHAKQSSDFDRGVHGGMNGYWDLSRGSRRRHGCIDCHDPHAPQFPQMVRTFQALDRFLAPATGETAHD